MTRAPALIGVRIPKTRDEDDLELPKPPGVFRRFWANHPRFTDALITVVVVVPSLPSIAVALTQPSGPPLWTAILHVVIVMLAGLALLLFRRTRPWLVLGVAWAACLLSAPFGSTDVLAILFALYGLGVYGKARSAWLGFGGSAVVVIAAVSVQSLMPWTALGSAFGGSLAVTVGVGAPPPTQNPSGLIIQNLSLMLFATLIGVTVGNRQRYVTALVRRAEDLARERDQRAQLAVAAERSRIARDLHDIVSHGLTVMVTLAEGSAATVASDPDRAAGLMHNVAETGRGALGDMRRMLNVLTEPGPQAAELAPQPGLADITSIVEGFRDTGLPVVLTTSGMPPTDPAIGVAAYRIVQEGLTNTLRHALNATRVDVRLTYHPDQVEVLVQDDSPPSAHLATTRGAGRGLTGLRERTALHNGTVDAGPRPDGGWRLQATLRTNSDSRNRA